MKARIVPIYFLTATDPDFVKQLQNIKTLFSNEAEILEPVVLGSKLPEAEAVIFPQMLGEAYRRVDDLQKLPQPLLVVTSEFGTVSMWDWEINNYLASKGITVVAPSEVESTRKAIKAIGLKRQLKEAKLLVYQDNPGEGFQADIFKRFYWWEKECIDCLESKFGVKVVKRSFKELGAYAKQIDDAKAEAVWKDLDNQFAIGDISHRALLSAVKIYIAVKEELDRDPSIISVGINCLNESAYSDTTPCLAWNILFEERGMIWGCEADIVSMMTKVLIGKALEVPFMMTNMYPFLMGMAALKHEKISGFPPVESEPENHILAAHCGFLGVVPKSFSTEWTLRGKVLGIVDENSTAIDARLPEGDVTLVKLMPPFDTMSVVRGKITGYAQFPGSDCRNGAIIRIPNGHKLMDTLASHHYIVTVGKNIPALEMVSRVFGLSCQEII